MSEYYHRDGTPSDVWVGSWNPADPDCKRVAEDENRNVRVSTVFLCLNHAWGEGFPPMIFETMVFGGSYDGDCERWTTEAEALAGHAHYVSLAMKPHPIMWIRRKTRTFGRELVSLIRRVRHA